MRTRKKIALHKKGSAKSATNESWTREERYRAGGRGLAADAAAAAAAVVLNQKCLGKSRAERSGFFGLLT